MEADAWPSLPHDKGKALSNARPHDAPSAQTHPALSLRPSLQCDKCGQEVTVQHFEMTLEQMMVGRAGWGWLRPTWSQVGVCM